MCGESSSPISWSIQIMNKKKSLLRPALIKQDWNLIDLELYESGYNISSAERTRGMLTGSDAGFLPSPVTASFCARGLLSPHTAVAAVSATAGLHACLRSSSQNTRLLWSLIESCEPVQAFISWQLMRFCRCWSKSFIERTSCSWKAPRCLFFCASCRICGLIH